MASKKTPAELLQDAADAAKAAEVARATAAKVEAEAKAAAKAQATADAKAKKTAQAAGAGNNSNSSEGGSKKVLGRFTLTQILFALVALAFLFIFLIACLKANKDDVESGISRVSAIATAANATATKAGNDAKAAKDAVNMHLAQPPCTQCCPAEEKKPKPKQKAKKDVVTKLPEAPIEVVTPVVVPVVVPPPPVIVPPPAPCDACVPAPRLNITTNSPRTDGRCVIAINDGGATKYVRLDQEKGSQRLLAFQVQNSTGDVDRNLPITYVGYINGSEKKTVELSGPPSCASSVKAFSEDRVFKWTAPRLQLGDKCKVVGRM